MIKVRRWGRSTNGDCPKEPSVQSPLKRRQVPIRRNMFSVVVIRERERFCAVQALGDARAPSRRPGVAYRPGRSIDVENRMLIHAGRDAAQGL